MRWRWSATLYGLLFSLLVTALGMLVLWHFFGRAALFGFLFLPFLGFGGLRIGRRSEDTHHSKAARGPRTCPRCGHQSWQPEDAYCPRDGSRLL